MAWDIGCSTLSRVRDSSNPTDDLTAKHGLSQIHKQIIRSRLIVVVESRRRPLDRRFGDCAEGTFAFIAFAMAVVVATIGGFGPRTRGLALEAIAH